ncbi:hypothetical protein L1049_015961 [Liquidambar formosana]|uniref:AIG1-type G domain-containing protein n=1 Tax=Liquidambar formosana TaxID=63359 RepID=A0AAP0S5N2_LIQFO
MENGVEIVGESHIGEVKGVGYGIIDERVEERVLGGSDESKDEENDEVFEEAIEQLQELPVKPDLGGGGVDEDGNVETILNSGSVVVDGNSSIVLEGETFEEAIGVPSELGYCEEERPVVVEEKVDDLVAGETVDGVLVVDGIDEGGMDKEASGNKLNGLVGNGEDNGKDIIDDVADGETEVLKNGEEVGDKTGVVLKKSENGDLELQEKLENGDANKVGENIVESRREDEANENLHRADETEVLKENNLEHQDDKSGELRDTSAGEEPNGLDNLDTKDKDDESWELKVSSVVEPGDDKGEELKNSLVMLDTGHQDGQSGELIGASASLDSGNHDDMSEEVKDTRADLVSECQNDKSGELEGALASVSSGNQDNKGEEGKGIPAVLDSEHEDDRRGGLKDTSAALGSEHHGENWKQNGISANLHASVQEATVTAEIVSSPSLKDWTVDKNEKIQVGTSDSGADDLKGSPLQHADKNVVEICNNHAVSEELAKKEAKDKEEKPKTQGNGVREIRPATEVASSSGKPLNPAASSARPAGLGRAAPLLEPAPRVVQQPQPRVNGTVSQVQAQLIEDPTNGEAEENDETREKLQMIRVKFLRLAHRLGQTPHNVVVAQVLYRLGLAEQLRGRNGGRVGAFSFDRASAMAEQLEAAGQEPLDFSCTIMVLGKTGVGKSATINSIFDEVKFGTDAFQLGTKKVQDVVGTVQGIKVRVIDTPGLLPSWSDQRQNEKILHSVKRFIKKTPPDIVLYLDRLDMQSRDFGDMPLLRTITEIFGPSIWFNAIVVLTHAASAPPDGPNGTASSYDMFVTQRSHVVQQAIRQAAGDMRLMNPVSLVENHSACRTNRAGQRVLPNGQVWKPHLLLLSFASKILAEANTLLKLQDSPPGKPFATRSRAPPLPFLLSSLLQSRPQLKLPEEQFGDEDTLDDDLEESSDSEDESEYDELPPFKRLTKAQLEKLTKQQKKAYFDELEYREKLFMKKQLKEEKKRRKMLKKMAASAKDLPSDYGDNAEEESGGAASVPVAMPDLALPASFDSDNPTHRYRYLDTSNQWLVRPVLETHGWDHDVGYEGINVERLFVVKDKIPLSFSGQVTKDKKDANLQMEVASSIKHGEGKATSLGFDMQTVGKDMAYTLRSETRFSNLRQNKATAGLSATLLGDALSAGVKIEDKLIVNKRFRVVMTGGAMTGRGDIAYGGSLEATLRDKDYPLGRSLSTLGLSIMDWHGDLAIGCNIQSQIPIGRSSNLIARANLNNRGAGQVSIRLNSSEQLQIALIGLIPLFRKLLGYSQQMQFGQ